jgi:hypothetical protein
LHPIDAGSYLFVIAHVGADAEGNASGMFDFEFGEVEFRRAAGEQSDAGSGRSETHGQAFPNSPARTGYQNTFIFK